MTTVTRQLAGLGLALAAAYALAWASVVPITPAATDDAVLRLAWRARPDRVEDCRALDEEAQQRLPAHMRQQKICDGKPASYRLEVRLDHQVLADEIVHAAGLRQDRPIYVLREMPVTPGEHHLLVRFLRQEADATEQPGSVPASLVLDRRVRVGPRSVLLVTYEPERREFVAMGGSGVTP